MPSPHHLHQKNCQHLFFFICSRKISNPPKMHQNITKSRIKPRKNHPYPIIYILAYFSSNNLDFFIIKSNINQKRKRNNLLKRSWIKLNFLLTLLLIKDTCGSFNNTQLPNQNPSSLYDKNLIFMYDNLQESS